MPIPDFDGPTFVAFTDICGFKEMMKREQRAIRALDQFYASGYSVLRDKPSVHGAFVSDCAVLFVSNTDTPSTQLLSLLIAIEELNRKVLEHDIMLTTSIAYGRFSYHQRLEFAGIEKNPIYGNAYVSAFLDNETRQPRMQPGECRIVKNGLDNLVHNVDRLRDRGKHLYFYWMVENEADIGLFTERYANAYEQKYRGMLTAMKEAANNRLARNQE
jgi:hypothetical protein